MLLTSNHLFPKLLNALHTLVIAVSYSLQIRPQSLSVLQGCLLEAYHLHISLNWLRTTTRPVSLFTGYQAPGTPGYDLQQAEGDIATVLGFMLAD